MTLAPEISDRRTARTLRQNLGEAPSGPRLKASSEASRGAVTGVKPMPLVPIPTVLIQGHATLSTPYCGLRASGRLRSSSVRRRRSSAGQLESEFVHVAPPPVLSGLEGSDQRMVGVGLPVSGGMSAGRTITASYVAAMHAEPQVHPAAPSLEAVLAPVAGRDHFLNGVEVSAGVSHGPSHSCVRTPAGSRRWCSSRW